MKTKITADEYVEILDSLVLIHNDITEHHYGKVCNCFREEAGMYLLTFFHIDSEDAIKAFEKSRRIDRLVGILKEVK